MRAAALCIPLLLSACDNGSDIAKAVKEDEADYARTHMNGRWQMLPGPSGKVYLLDTAQGSLQICGPDPVDASLTCSNTVAQQ